MIYYLKKAVLNPSAKVEISRQSYFELKKSREFLSPVLSIEEQWDCVIQNYIELEQDILREAVNSMVILHDDYSAFQDIRLGFSRRLSNVLSSNKSYLHHTPQHLQKTLIQDPKNKFSEITRQAYDKYYGFRFMEALRNYTQHRGVPIDEASFGVHWINNDKNERKGLRHNVAASISLEKLKSDKKFKTTVLEEMPVGTKKINLAPLLREHMEALGEIHDNVRKLVFDDLKSSKKALRIAIADYKNANDGNALGLCAFKCSEDGTVIDTVNILEEVIIRIEKLIIRNGSMQKFSKRYVTNELLVK